MLSPLYQFVEEMIKNIDRYTVDAGGLSCLDLRKFVSIITTKLTEKNFSLEDLYQDPIALRLFKTKGRLGWVLIYQAIPELILQKETLWERAKEDLREFTSLVEQFLVAKGVSLELLANNTKLLQVYTDFFNHRRLQLAMDMHQKSHVVQGPRGGAIMLLAEQYPARRQPPAPAAYAHGRALERAHHFDPSRRQRHREALARLMVLLQAIVGAGNAANVVLVLRRRQPAAQAAGPARARPEEIVDVDTLSAHDEDAIAAIKELAQEHAQAGAGLISMLNFNAYVDNPEEMRARAKALLAETQTGSYDQPIQLAAQKLIEFLDSGLLQTYIDALHEARAEIGAQQAQRHRP